MLELDRIICGDCLEVLKTLPEDSVDAIVTDPPAGIAFMGKEWDQDKGGRNAWIGWMAQVASECLRVIKPGGHALVWALPRTSHWTGMAWEEAGWEPRDKISHVFGSGFPKSLDISKQIDRRGGQSIGWFGRWLRQWREENGITQKDIAALFPSKTGNLTGCVANWELNLNMPTCEQFNLICKTFNLPFNSLEEAEREVIGQNPNGFGPNRGASLTHGLAAHPDITAPATPAAKQWAGWGSAIKPAHEDWWLFRKPLSEKTIAENVLRWGTGGLNIDGCRIGTNGEQPTGSGDRDSWRNMENRGDRQEHGKNITPPSGRFPANLIHDGSPEVLAEFAKAGERKSGNRKVTKNGQRDDAIKFLASKQTLHDFEGDTGSAARFFQSCPFTEEDIPAFLYYAKASRAERERGLAGMPVFHKSVSSMTTRGERERGESRDDTSAKNHHPTVKPLSLMRYLCRLITPPDGLILDPFAGSGTTCMAAKAEGFHYIGIEREAEYAEIARRRIAAIPTSLSRWVEDARQ